MSEVRENEDRWREKLTDAEYRVLREGGTEAPWTGEYVDEKRAGVYRCRACGAELFRSDTKFDSHCGWPSFWTPMAGEKVELLEDRSLGMERTEVVCATCGGHLGHLFDDPTATEHGGKHYCINSVCLNFDPNPPN